MRRSSEVFLVAALGLERASRMIYSEDPPGSGTEPLAEAAVLDRNDRFTESRGLILNGLSIQLSLLALSGLAFQVAFPSAPQWLRILIAGGIASMFLVANYWVMALMPRADWARFFKQTLEASERRREREGWKRTRWLRRWYHRSWKSDVP